MEDHTKDNHETVAVAITVAGPPPLPYDLRSRKASIIIHWSGILISCCILPVVLYYSLHHGTSMDETLVLAITVAASGGLSLFDNARRTYLLLRRSAESRPLFSGRWTLDFFHINFLVSFVPITIFFTMGCALRPARLDLVALPIPFLLTFVSLQVVLFTLLADKTNMRTLFRISSVRRGEKMRPPLYCMIEDVVAVNGGGGKQYRAALDERYRASRRFRQLLVDMGLFWGIPGFVLGVVLIVLIGTIDPQISYGLSWTLPWLWTGVWAAVTIRLVQRALRHEASEFAAVS